MNRWLRAFAIPLLFTYAPPIAVVFAMHGMERIRLIRNVGYLYSLGPTDKTTTTIVDESSKGSRDEGLVS